MTKPPRLTPETLKVLDAIISAGADPISGAQISRATGLPSGTLYPILIRLEKAAWLESDWEAADPRELGRPRRRLYSMTNVGRAQARSAAEALAPIAGRLAWA